MQNRNNAHNISSMYDIKLIKERNRSDIILIRYYVLCYEFHYYIKFKYKSF